MTAISNSGLRTLGEGALRAWKKLKNTIPNAEYAVTVRGRQLICWTTIPGASANLYTMHVHREGEGPLLATYLHVSPKSGDTVRALSRFANTLELERWFTHYPGDRDLLVTQAVA